MSVSPAALVLRPVSHDRLDPLLLLVSEYFAFEAIPFDPGTVRQAYAWLIDHPAWGGAFFAQADGEEAGYAVLALSFDAEFGGLVCLLTDLYLRPRFRNAGLGTQVLDLLEAQARAWGARALEAQVTSENRPAQEFYRRRGFEFLPRLPITRPLR